jgi:very-short-patch-repair endonuclease
MSAVSTAITFAAFAGVAVVGLALLKAKLAAKPDGAAWFKAKPLLTPNELEFLIRLETAAPELRFHAQVSMGAVLEAAVSKKMDAKAHMSARGRFSQKIIDFVAQRRDDGAIVAMIELDDRTHSADKDSKRDAMLEQAGYRVVRWQSKNKPDATAIRAALFPPTIPLHELALPTKSSGVSDSSALTRKAAASGQNNRGA